MAIASGDTKDRIMLAARLTVQDRGYGGLSFRELAKEVGIKSASIHHYFPTKGELGSALGGALHVDFLEYLDGLLADGLDQKACMQKYTEVFGANRPQRKPHVPRRHHGRRIQGTAGRGQDRSGQVR